MVFPQCGRCVRNLLNGYKGCWERMVKVEAVALCGRCQTSCTGYRFPGAKGVENWLQSPTEVRKTWWEENCDPSELDQTVCNNFPKLEHLGLKNR